MYIVYTVVLVSWNRPTPHIQNYNSWALCHLAERRAVATLWCQKRDLKKYWF